MRESGLKDSCYKATVTEEFGIRGSAEKPWESVGTPTSSSLHLRQHEEENCKGMSQTGIDADGVRGCLGDMYFSRSISFLAKQG